MKILLRMICISVIFLSQSTGVGQCFAADPVLHLELGTMTTDNELDQNALFLDLNMETGGRDWTVLGSSPATPGAQGVLVLELSPLSGPGGLASAMGLDEAFVSAQPNVLLLEFGMIPEDLSEENLETLLAGHPGMLVLEMDYLFEVDPESGQTEAALSNPATLLLELAPIAEKVAQDNQDVLLLQLEAIQGGPALRQPSDFFSHLLALYAPSLIGHWRLWEGEGYIAWDYSGYDNDGTLTQGLDWTSEGLQFDGGHIRVPYDDSLEVDEGLTIAVWVYLPDAIRYQTILGKLSPDQQSGFLLRIINEQSCPMIWDSSEAVYPDLWESIPANTWTHLAVTWESGGDLIGYLNGDEVGRISASAQPIGFSEDELIIGANPLDPAFAQVNGLVADIRLYDVPLSATAIQILATGWGNESWEGEGIAGAAGSAGLPGDGSSGSGAGAYDAFGSFGLEGNNPDLMITEDVIGNLEKEKERMNPKIVEALKNLQGRRFTETGNNTYVLVKAVGEELFKKYEDKFKEQSKMTEGMKKGLPEELRETLEKLKDKDYGDPEKFANAVKAKLREAIDWKELVRHTNVQKEFMITDAALKKLNLNVEDYSDLKNKRFLSEKAFKKAVGEKLGDDFDKHKDKFGVGDDEFIITQEILESWSKSPDLKDRLQGLKDQQFVSEDAFDDTVKAKLGEDAFTPYKEQLVQIAEEGQDGFTVTDQVLSRLTKLQNISGKFHENFQTGQQFDNKAAFLEAVKNNENIGENDFQLIKNWLDAAVQGIKEGVKFTLTQDMLAEVPRSGDIKGVHEKLKTLEGRHFDSEGAFTQAMQAKLGESAFEQHEAKLREARVANFSITKTTLKQLKEGGVPEKTRRKLKKLIGQQFGGKEDFTRVVKAEIEEDNLSEDFEKKLLKHAQMKDKKRAAEESRASKSNTQKKRAAKRRRHRKKIWRHRKKIIRR